MIIHGEFPRWIAASYLKIENQMNCMNFKERWVGNKKIVWLQPYNRYLLLEMPAYEVIKGLMNNDDPGVIGEELSRCYDLPLPEARRFVDEIRLMMEQIASLMTDVPVKCSPLSPGSVDADMYSIKRYKINGQIYAAEYGSEQIENLIHPKFAYLECSTEDKADHTFQVFHKDGQSVLKINGALIGQWLREHEHFLSGKFSMELVNRIYHKNETDWMGVFHASAISAQNKSILFLGDSGSGKSTICAILMASGYNLVADDFVPVDGLSGRVYPFPAALSVKKSALAPLLHLFPGLALADEFSYPAMDKTVRYLPPVLQSENSPADYPCKALVFVRYEEHSGMNLERLSKDIAFQKLVPDSWRSPVEANAGRFLDWFLDLPCYRLTYSDNEKMVAEIQKIFNDEL